MGIVELFSRSIRGILALGIVLPTVAATIYGVPIPEWLQTMTAMVAGYYFASKTEEALRK